MTERPLFLYKAFISNCESDEAMGQWLAQSLRDYKVGRSLLGDETHAGRIAPHPGLIFSRQAQESLRPLSGDVVHALFGSQYLIVIASRHCPRSDQVNREIKLFKHYHGENRILYVAIDDRTGHLFPPAALFHVDADGALTDREAHPGQIIEGGARSAALIERIVAYLLGMSLDRLAAARARDRWERRAKWAAAGVVLMILAPAIRGIVMQLSRSMSEGAPLERVSSSPMPPGGETPKTLSPPPVAETRPSKQPDASSEMARGHLSAPAHPGGAITDVKPARRAAKAKKSTPRQQLRR